MKKILIPLLLTLSITITTAHPHMFFSNRYTLDVQQDSLKGFWVDWIFDIYFSQEILFDYDLDQNRQFSPQETQDVHDYAFINLAKYNYFQLIRQGDQRYKVEEISDFQVFTEGDNLAYRFYVSLENFQDGDIYLATYDPTFFCAIKYAEEPVLFTESSSFQFRLEETTDHPVYYDPFGAPTHSPIYEQWEPGLEVFHPIEAHIWHE